MHMNEVSFSYHMEGWASRLEKAKGNLEIKIIVGFN